MTPFLLFATHDALTKSLGFSPFQLIFGHEVRSPLHLFIEKVVETTVPGDVLQYVSTVRLRLQSARETAGPNA